MNERIRVKQTSDHERQVKWLPFSELLLNSEAFIKQSTGFKISGGFHASHWLYQNCGNTCTYNRRSRRFPWMFRPFLVIGLKAREAKCGNQGQDIFLLFSRWGRRALPFIFIFQTYQTSQKASFLWLRKEINALLGCVFHLSHFAVMTMRSWLLLYIAERIRPFHSHWHMSILLFEEVQALEQASFQGKGWIHFLLNAIDKDIHSQHLWVTF